MAPKPWLRLGLTRLRLSKTVGQALLDGSGSAQAQLKLRLGLVRKLQIDYIIMTTTTTMHCSAEQHAKRTYADNKQQREWGPGLKYH